MRELTDLEIQLAAAPLIRDEEALTVLTGSRRAAIGLVQERREALLYIEVRDWQARIRREES